MEIVRIWEEEGVTVPKPYNRHLKVLLAPDKKNVHEISFNQALIYPHSKTDYHTHDRPELILIVTGRGISVCDGVETPIEPETALWIRKGEMHQIINTGEDTMKLATVFIPPYTSEELYGTCMKAAEDATKAEK
jgi:mannose-6-phosphate isomerase-like protein (cupin superfamily)